MRTENQIRTELYEDAQVQSQTEDQIQSQFISQMEDIPEDPDYDEESERNLPREIKQVSYLFTPILVNGRLATNRANMTRVDHVILTALA